MHKHVGFLTLAIVAMTGVLAASDTDTDTDTAALIRARQQLLEFRQGNLKIAGPLVKELEGAVAKSPKNSDLLEALGNAYMSQQGAMFESQAKPEDMIAVGDRARDAYARALALD